MRKIEKGTEPASWLTYRLTPNAQYQRTADLAESLLKEQGYLCAYCMRQIPARDGNSNETTRIDHILSRDNHEALQLDYSNMVICCPGAINDDFHCDKLKGENDITIPLHSIYIENSITYNKSDGAIKCENDDWDDQMNKILNLNNSMLKENRKRTLLGVVKELSRRKPWKASDIRKMIEAWRRKGSNGKFKPYNGIVIWYLSKKLKQLHK